MPTNRIHYAVADINSKYLECISKHDIVSSISL